MGPVCRVCAGSVAEESLFTVTNSAFNRILHDRRLHTLFQPIVRMSDGETVAFEALVRGPTGSRYRSAPTLLAEAYRTAQVVELDWAARASACRAAMAAELSPAIPLFLNIEPLALDTDCPADLRADIDAAYRHLQIVLEVTERSLDRDPRSLLDGTAAVRDAAAGIAVDDVGANAGTLAMLAILEPEIVKLDLRLVRGEPTRAVTRVLDYVYAEAERTGAAILAEGVETRWQADLARSMGADLAQGHHFGRPRPMPQRPRLPTTPLMIRPRQVPCASTPFDAALGCKHSRASARLLRPLSHQIENSVDLVESAMLIAVLPASQPFNAADYARFVDLAQRGPLTGVLGRNVAIQQGDGIRGGCPGDEAFDSEWAVI
ncbi:MAG TPA: EAL domain-containing protein, partial [Micromonosporaceae bacterium]